MNYDTKPRKKQKALNNTEIHLEKNEISISMMPNGELEKLPSKEKDVHSMKSTYRKCTLVNSSRPRLRVRGGAKHEESQCHVKELKLPRKQARMS